MRFSIITVVYNNQQYIEDCIESVKNQTYKNIEYIVVDGGSNDGTVDIIKKFDHYITKWISEPDRGIYDAMNKGIQMASGEIIGFLNADDMFFDGNVVSQIAAEFSPDTDCIYGNLVYVNRSNVNKVTRRWISSEFKDGFFEKSWTPAHPTFYCRKRIYDQYGTYRLDFKISSDTELMFRFLQKHRVKSKFVNHYFVKMRDRGISNRGLKSIFLITTEMKKVITENGSNFNLVKYLFFKFLKIKQILFRNKA